MSTALPTKLFQFHLLAEVPRSVYMDAPQLADARDQKKRLAFLSVLRRKADSAKPAAAASSRTKLSLNAAVWMKFREVPEKPLSLVLVYRDQKGEFALVVDEARVGSTGSVMLSGNVSLQAFGEIEYIHACLTGLEAGQGFSVDELYVQKVKEEQTQTQKHSA